MDPFKRTLRFGAAVIACAAVARLGASGAFRPISRWFTQPETQSLLLYLETGRKVRFSPSLEEITVPVEETTAATVPETEPPALPAFSAGDAALLDIRYNCSLRPDLEALLEKPLSWDLSGPEPKVLILHTHATESYTKQGEDYRESSAFRTLDEDYNMISIGARVAQLLREAGIEVIHDKTLHDYPSYNGSYTRARKTLRQQLKEHPGIQLVLDLHRDASGDLNDQLKTAVTRDGTDYAGLMLVVGTDASGLRHPDWRENLALGLKLQALLEDTLPGITRPISFRSQRFNPDMTRGSLIVEVGAAGDSHQQALNSMEILAQAILSLSKGSK